MHVMMLAHSQREHVLVADEFFVDNVLDLQTQRHRLLRRYQESNPSEVTLEIVDAVRNWPA